MEVGEGQFDWYSTGMTLLATAVVIGFASLGSICNRIIKGTEIGSWKYPGIFQSNECFKAIDIPSLAFMIIFGCIARNYLPQELMVFYDQKLGQYIRSVCLTVHLLRGGLEMSFKGKGLVVGLVSVIPQIFEAIAVGLCAMHFWGFPLALALALGFLIAGVSPAVVIPLMISFKNREVGKKKGIPDILLAACTLDVNLSILWFGVFMQFEFNKLLGAAASGDVLWDSLFIIFQIVVGIVLGAIVAQPMRFFTNRTLWTKCIAALSVSLGMVFLFEIISFQQSQYVGIISFGMVTNALWERAAKDVEDQSPPVITKPSAELRVISNALIPFLYGTIGAAIDLSQLRGDFVGLGSSIILGCVFFRSFVTLICFVGNFTFKEKLVAAFSWLPKATVQASIGGVCYDLALSISTSNPLRQTYINYGLEILQLAVLSVLITAPLGAILATTFGNMWLDKPDQKEDPSKVELQEARQPLIDNKKL